MAHYPGSKVRSPIPMQIMSLPASPLRMAMMIDQLVRVLYAGPSPHADNNCLSHSQTHHCSKDLKGCSAVQFYEDAVMKNTSFGLEPQKVLMADVEISLG